MDYIYIFCSFTTPQAFWQSSAPGALSTLVTSYIYISEKYFQFRKRKRIKTFHKENFWQSENFTAVFTKNTKKRLNFPKFAHNFPVDTGHKLNLYKTFRTRPGRLLNILCAFSLSPVSTRFPSEKVNFSLIYLTYISIHNF